MTAMLKSDPAPAPRRRNSGERPRSYSLADAIAFTGAKRSQIEHWVRSGIVTPEKESRGTGDHRRFSLMNLVQIGVAAELVDCDITVRHMPAIFQLTINKHWARLCDPRRRADVAILTLWYMSRFATDKPHEGPAGRSAIGGMPSLMSIAGILSHLSTGETLRGAINVKRVIEVVEAVTGERLG